MQPDLDSLPTLTPRQAYLAMLEFLNSEFELAGTEKTVHLGGLLAELAPESDGSSSDPGGVLTFTDAVVEVLSPTYRSAWSELEPRA